MLEAELLNPNIWEDQEKATEINKEIFEIKEDIEKISCLKKELTEINDFFELDDDSLEDEVNKKLTVLEKKIEKQETLTYFSGKYDKRNVIVEIFSGAGGQDAQDWVAMIFKMYENYLTSEGFKVKVIEQSYGEKGGPDGRMGIKEISFEVEGSYAYGFLKMEKGVHRLIRISPFSSKQTRHTSFAMVDVFPEINYGKNEIEIKPDEIRVETYKSSGPGGQNVNKRETAVRVIHLSTGLIASSQNSRYQGANKEKAMKILTAKIHRYNEEKKEKEIKKIKGKVQSIEWGSQIRSYILHPYKLVKDHRTEFETTKVEEVLDGKIEDIIKQGIKF